MFREGDLVQYGVNGVCKITQICEENFCGKKEMYYILTPVTRSNNTVYVPLSNEALVGKMRRILQPEEIYAIIDAMPDEKADWIEDSAARKETFRTILKSGDCFRIMKMIKSLYLHKQELLENGKKLHAGDEQLFREAENILCEEFALVLHIQKDEVVPLIAKKLDRQSREKALS